MEERIKELEIKVKRLLRRSKTQKVKAIVTPYPISNVVFGDDIRGPVLCYMFPSMGMISKGLIVLDSKPKAGVKVIVQIENDLGGGSREFIITRKNLLVEPKMEVDSGDRLKVSIEPIEDSKVTEIWTAFLWKPSTSDVEVKKFLAEEIEEDVPG